MNKKEAELVTEDFIRRKDNYNLCPGGKGGFGYINRTRNHKEHNQKIADKRDYSISLSGSQFTSERVKEMWKKGAFKGNSFVPSRIGTKHSEETKKKMSESGSGIKNSQFNSKWMRNTLTNEVKKVKSINIDECLASGWILGRK